MKMKAGARIRKVTLMFPICYVCTDMIIRIWLLIHNQHRYSSRTSPFALAIGTRCLSAFSVGSHLEAAFVSSMSKIRERILPSAFCAKTTSRPSKLSRSSFADVMEIRISPRRGERTLERRISTHDKERLEGSERPHEHEMLRDSKPVHMERSSWVASRIANQGAKVRKYTVRDGGRS